MARLPAIAAPVLIIHSPSDEIVPFSHAERLHAAARAPKRLMVLAGGHNDGFVFQREEWIRGLADFLEESAR
ncbi:MAG: hypothetical protein ACM3SS_05145 [Rhodospirillaceae bacterium]